MTLVGTLAAALSHPNHAALLSELFSFDETGAPHRNVPTEHVGSATVCAESILGVASRLGRPVEVALVRVSSGIVVGLDLRNGGRVVVKVHRGHSGPRLRGVLRAQRALDDAKFPVASPLITEPVAVGSGWATLETWHADGDTVDVRPVDFRRAVAVACARIVETLDPVDFDDLRPQWTGPYPPPHSPNFDFQATSHGAEWIDARNDSALIEKTRFRDRRVGRTVVAHTDLRPENVRLRTDSDAVVSAIYDLDSLVVDAEPWLVGGVARAFSTNWSDADPMIPKPDEIVAFIHDYEAARGLPFTGDEWGLAHAGVTHALAYSARCEHALFSDGGAAPWGPGWRDLLRRWER